MQNPFCDKPGVTEPVCLYSWRGGGGTEGGRGDGSVEEARQETGRKGNERKEVKKRE